jgi:ketol-acid reductoisomerase
VAQLYAGDDVTATLKGKRVAILGYGNQGEAQALNLRDRGFDVVVGNREDEYAERARRDGLVVLDIAAASASGDVVVVLLPDEVQPHYQNVFGDLRAGQTLVFASGYNLAFKRLGVSSFCDVVLAAPRMLGAGVRDLVQKGRGFPMLVAAHQDVSEQAMATALAYCEAVGAFLPGGVAVASSFREEAILDLFSEHTWAASLTFFLEACFDVLTHSGISEEAALLELYASGELGTVGAAIAERGLFAQMALHSTTSQYGQLTRGPGYITEAMRERLEAVLRALADGSFAREWGAAEGTGRLEELRRRASDTPVARAEERLYRILGRRP